MNNIAIDNPSWSTASFGDTADTTPIELSVLGDHLKVCKAANSRLLALHCFAETIHGFMATRFVTTIVVLTLLIGVIV